MSKMTNEELLEALIVRILLATIDAWAKAQTLRVLSEFKFKIEQERR